MPTCRKKGKSQLVLFSLASFANKINWNFPFIRPVAFYSRIQTKGQKAGPHSSIPLNVIDLQDKFFRWEPLSYLGVLICFLCCCAFVVALRPKAGAF